jgi:transglutaminase-like putative cysteine protease
VNTALNLRNTLWLIASFALVAAPHVERIAWWLTLLLASVVLWRLYLARLRLPLPGRAVLLVMVITVTASLYVHYGTFFGRDAAVALLVLMLGLKLLEVRTARDGMLLILLSYFLVIANFLYSQTVPTALYMLLCVWIVTASMIGIHSASSRRSTIDPLRTAGVLLVQSVPLMLVLFILFPRVHGPLWGLPPAGERSSTGLTDTMTPGSIMDLTLSEEVAFRAVFASRMPEVRRLYWRGPVLTDFDGRTWHAPRATYSEQRYGATYAPVEYTVTLEAHGKPWLFALDLPGKLPPRSVATSDLQVIYATPITSRFRYDMVSFLDYTYGENESASTLRGALRLPRGFNPRAIAYGQELRERYREDRDIMQAVLRAFNEGYTYTLSPPLLGEHSVDEFLFGTKKGFCEHYAAAFAVLMRAAGIPARVVTGYLGGEVNPIGDYLIVRQADAHAWNEIWLRGEGWVRVDPTAAVAPARIERGLTAAVADTRALPLFIRANYPLLRELRLTWDSLANTWNQRVLGYTPERQRALLTRVGLDDATWRTLAALLLAIASAVTMVLGFLTLRRLRVRIQDPVKLAYTAFCNKLHDIGIGRAPAEGPLSYADRVSSTRPDLEAPVRHFTALYVGLRYAGAMSDARSVEELQALARQFKPLAGA